MAISCFAGCGLLFSDFVDLHVWRATDMKVLGVGSRRCLLCNRTKKGGGGSFGGFGDGCLVLELVWHRLWPSPEHLLLLFLVRSGRV